MTRWTHGLINRLVLICDGAMLMLGAIVAHLVWGVATLAQMQLLVAFGAVVFAEVLLLGDAYRVEHYGSPLRQMRHLLVAGVPAALAVLGAAWVLIPETAYNSGAILKWALATYACLLFGRLVLVRTLSRFAERNAVLRRNVVLVGARDRIRGFVEHAAEKHTTLLNIVGAFCDEPLDEADEIGGIPVRGSVEDLSDFVHSVPVDVVVVLESFARIASIGRILESAHRIAADVFVPLDQATFNPRFARMASVAGLSALQVQQQPFKGSLGVLKAVEDYLVAMIGLVVTAPVLLFAAIAVKLDSRGPVLFEQQRIGFNGGLFTVYKFRTMKVDASDDGAAGTARNDPRVTSIGRFLRRTSIDELPQLLNVLRGDMSVVGPRPHVPNMLVGDRSQFDAVREYAARFRVKPGITGWAQINGMRGGIHTVEKARRGAELDLYYIENWSIWLDIKIMLLTLTKGLAGRDVF